MRPPGPATPFAAFGIGSGSGMPPASATVKSWVYRPVNTALPDVNSTAPPSAVNAWTMSAPGCHVSRAGTPPSTGTT